MALCVYTAGGNGSCISGSFDMPIDSGGAVLVVEGVVSGSWGKAGGIADEAVSVTTPDAVVGCASLCPTPVWSASGIGGSNRVDTREASRKPDRYAPWTVAG
eukprot:m.193874 g.193874  ORF g.193874 m.193874 type:complete len:102 (-) comp19063_c0_seq1:2754-3059(-)